MAGGDGAGRGCFGVVDRKPLRGRFMWPFDVAMLGGRYLLTAWAVRYGAPRRNPCRIAASSERFGGLPRLWCMNFTLFSAVVQWYEKLAASVRASLNLGQSDDWCLASREV